MNTTYIVCSYGGSGSWMLVKYLKNFGKAYHVHDRYPPTKLTYPNIKTERFSQNEIPSELLSNFKVIFIYKNPVNAIFSRFNSIYHLHNIQSKEMEYKNIFQKNEDLFGIGEYYDNYMNKNDRNYQIICIKYETFFENIQKINKILDIPDIPTLYPIKKETNRKCKPDEYKHLMNIYSNLIKDMNETPPIVVN